MTKLDSGTICRKISFTPALKPACRQAGEPDFPRFLLLGGALIPINIGTVEMAGVKNRAKSCGIEFCHVLNFEI
ncbi:hypothetical protein [Sinomicrobium sp. M5D2P17]